MGDLTSMNRFSLHASNGEYCIILLVGYVLCKREGEIVRGYKLV